MSLMRLIFLGLTFFSLNVTFAQENRIQNYIDLDTTFSFPKSNKIFYDDLALNIFDGDLWIYFPGQRSDTLDFTVINLENFEMEKLFCPFPSMYLKIDSPISSDLAVSDNFICLGFDGSKKLIVIDKRTNNLVLKNIVPIKEHLEVFSITGDYLYFAQNYYYHPNDSRTVTSIGKYNLETGFLENLIDPKFDGIEFTYFMPNHWIDFSNDGVIFSQTVRQEFLIYDNNLDLKQSIKNGRPNGWNPYSTELKDELVDGVELGKPIIYAMEDLVDTLDRVQCVYFINDNTFIVQNKHSESFRGKKYGSIDVWKKNNIGEFELSKSDIMDRGFQLSDLISKSNYPIQLQYFNNTFGNDKLVQWRFDAGVNMLGKTLEEVQNEAERFFMDFDNEEKYILKIFSIHDL